MDLPRLRNDLRRSVHVTEPPARDRKRLRERRAHHRALRHPRQRRKIRVPVRRVDDVLVNFVGEHKHVELLREGRDLQQLVPREYPPARIRRIAEHKRLQAARENLSQLIRIKTIVRRVQRHMHRLRPGQNRVGIVVFVKWREEPDFVSRVTDGHHRNHHRFGRAAGDHKFAVAVHRHAHTTRDFRTQRGPQFM